MSASRHRKVRKHKEILWFGRLQAQESQETQRNTMLWASPGTSKSGNTKKYNALGVSTHRKVRKHKEIQWLDSFQHMKINKSHGNTMV